MAYYIRETLLRSRTKLIGHYRCEACDIEKDVEIPRHGNYTLEDLPSSSAVCDRCKEFKPVVFMGFKLERLD